MVESKNTSDWQIKIEKFVKRICVQNGVGFVIIAIALFCTIYSYSQLEFPLILLIVLCSGIAFFGFMFARYFSTKEISSILPDLLTLYQTEFESLNRLQNEHRRQFVTIEDSLSKNLSKNIGDTNSIIQDLSREKERFQTELDHQRQAFEVSLERKKFLFDMRLFLIDFHLFQNIVELDAFEASLPSEVNQQQYIDTIGTHFGFSTKILQFLFRYHRNIADVENWNAIKKSNKDLQDLMLILAKSGKLAVDSRQFPMETQILFLQLIKTFNIDYFNQILATLSKYAEIVTELRAFFTKGLVTFDEIKTWKDLAEISKKLLPNNQDVSTILWDCILQSFTLGFKTEHERDIKLVLTFQFVKEKKPVFLPEFCRKISNFKNACAILRYFIQTCSSDEFGKFFQEHQEELDDVIKLYNSQVLQTIFCDELGGGQLIQDDNDLLATHVKSRVKSEKYGEIYEVIFNPKNQVNLNNALKKVFAIRISDAVFIESLSLNPKIKPYLLSFKTDAGSLQLLLDNATNLDKKTDFDLNKKYNLDHYTNQARIGILNEIIPDLNTLAIELEKDLIQKIKEDSITQDCYDNFREFVNAFQEDLKKSVDINDLREKFALIFENKFDKDDFLHLIPENIRTSNSEIYNKFSGVLEKFPPSFQILIHELKYDPKAIKVFGPSEKINPFEKMKKLFAETIPDPMQLMALLEYNQDKRDLKEINKDLIRHLTVYDLLCSHLEEAKQWSAEKHKDILGKLGGKATAKLFETFGEDIRDVLQLSFFIATQLGLNVEEKIWSAEECAVFADEKIKENSETLVKFSKFFGSKLGLSIDSETVKDYASSLLMTLLYIAMVVYHEIIKVPSISIKDIISIDDYETILRTCFQVSREMERAPGSFQGLEEEQIRNRILADLNGIVPVATGETFNRSGKTDILINHNGKIIFIAECKFWKGEQQYLKGLEDQLFNYITWRETKTAILVFNKEVKSETVYEKIKEIMSSHPCHISDFSYKSCELRQRGILGYVFHHPTDKKRLFNISVLLFHIPKI